MNNELRNVRLYGRLGAKFGRVHRLAVQSAAEAFRALSMMLPGFEAYVTQSQERGEGYAIFYDKRNLSVDQLHNPVSRADIRVAPVLMGAKKQGWGQIITGAIIIVVSLVIDYYTGGAFGKATKYQTYIMGASMILGGIVQMLTPVPKGRSGKDRPEDEPSYAFNGPINTQAQGNPVPVLYGESIVGSAVISAGISVADQAIIPAGGSTDAGGGGSSRYNDEHRTQLQ